MAAEFINTIESASGEAIDQAIEDEIASAIDTLNCRSSSCWRRPSYI